jgi:hypothetical protein
MSHEFISNMLGLVDRLYRLLRTALKERTLYSRPIAPLSKKSAVGLLKKQRV